MQRRAFMAAFAALGAAGTTGGALATPAGGERVLLKSYVTRLDAGLLDRLAASSVSVKLRLRPARERRFDPSSLAVETSRGEVIGYLPGTHSRAVSPLIEEGFVVKPKAVAVRLQPRPALEVDIWLDG